MNDERRQVIVKEIEHWRRSKLLPDQYCDFLLNLYQDPDQRNYASPKGRSMSQAFAVLQQATGRQWLLTFAFFTLISFVVLYFNAFHPLLQIAVVSGSTAALLWYGERVRRRNEAAGLVIIGIGLLTCIACGLYVVSLHGWDEWYGREIVLSLNALLWIIYGLLARIYPLQLCGWMTAALVYAGLLSAYTAQPKWYEVQLYWLPVAALFGWSAWFVHRYSKPVSAVLFCAAGLLWFMPELYSLIYLDTAAAPLQVQLLVKFIVGGTLLFSMRKQWMVWVA
ncbi:hypothetical protein ACFO9Q_17060 [Paenibacillus sp. GCM10023252]|uniref:hypothetical protein n=1 Tax=Paenibacillus sp. GCM10023252 TaxID=3252649 RepID=UPI003606DB30